MSNTATARKTVTRKPAVEKNAVGVDAVEFVSGDSGRTYQIARVMKRNKPIVACTCPGFSRWKRCKHSTEVIETGKMPKGVTVILNRENFDKRLVEGPKKPAAAKVPAKKTGKVSASPKKPVQKVVKPRTKKIMVGGAPLVLNAPVNIKVAGERVMRKNVILALNESKPGFVMVKTGSRGRPANLDVTVIEKFRAL
jgi:hypothetical protein